MTKFRAIGRLQPGVTVVDGGVIDPTKSNTLRAVRVNGGSGTGTRVQIEGIDVTDETGLQNVSVSIDGNVVQTYTYENGVNFRWWFDNYPFDNSLSSLEGPCYYVNIPDSYKGQSHLVEVIAVDIYGHRTVTSAVLGL